MKISELPKDVRLLALDYQKNQIDLINNKYDKNTNQLCYAFSWNHTMEGFEYWMDWDIKKSENKKFEYDLNGVTKPKQYQIGIDTFQRAEANLSKEEILAICKFNIDKYTWRKKNQDKQDFEKIIDYANWAIKNL